MQWKLEIFTAVKSQVAVFSDVTPCSVVVGYQRLGGPCCLQLQVEVNCTGTGIGTCTGTGCIAVDSLIETLRSKNRSQFGLMTRFSSSQNHFTTDGQSVSLGIEPLRDSWPDFGCNQDSCSFVCHGASSLSRWRLCHVTGHSLAIYTYERLELYDLYIFFFHFVYRMPLYTPGLSGQALYSRLCLRIIYYLRVWWQLRYLKGSILNRHQIWAHYVSPYGTNQPTAN
jgi:hypothetical protein